MNGLSAVIAGVWAVSKFTCSGDWCDVNCDDRPGSAALWRLLMLRLALPSKLLTLLSGGALIYAIGVLLGFFILIKLQAKRLLPELPLIRWMFCGIGRWRGRGVWRVISRNLSIACGWRGIARALCPSADC